MIGSNLQVVTLKHLILHNSSGKQFDVYPFIQFYIVLCNFRLETKLHEMEKKYSLLHRWLPSDEEFKECEGFVHSSKNEQLLLQVWKAGQRRMFLLNLKKKYAG